MVEEPKRLELSEDEAYALLHLAMMSEAKFCKTSEQAVAKLAKYCKSNTCNDHKPVVAKELCEAG